MNVVNLLKRAAETWPETDAIVDSATGEHLLFAQFFQRIVSTAARIGALVGHRTGARIALLGDSSIDYLCTDYGVMYGGFVRVPLDPSLAATELAAQLSDAGATLLLFGKRQAELAVEIAVFSGADLSAHALEGFGQQEIAIQTPSFVDVDGADIASLNYTGGSTGRPKAVIHTHTSLIAALQNIVTARAAAPGDAFLNVRPLWPIAAIVVLGHLVAGGTIVLGGAFAPALFWDLLSVYGISHSSLVPTQLHRLLREMPAEMPSLDRLKSIDIGAAAVVPELYEQTFAVFGPRIAVLYGLTEAPWSCYRPPSDAHLVQRHKPETHGNVGRPTFSCDLAIMDQNGPCPPGIFGEVCIQGPHVMRAYWNQPELSADVMRGGWFRTGDLGFIDHTGRLLIRGRAKDIIRTGGKSVQPREVEEAISKHPAVREIAVIGLPDAEWGEIVAAAVVLRETLNASVDELMMHCRSHLSSYKRPKRLCIVEGLPRSHYGKIQRAKLVEAFASGLDRIPRPTVDS